MELGFDTGRPLLELAPEIGLGLEAETWPAGPLWNKPVRKLSPGELLWLITQGVGLRITIPLAMERLEQTPFVQAGEHAGDLLTAVLETAPQFWLEQEGYWLAMAGILEGALTEVTQLLQARGDNYLPWHLGDDLIAAAVHFRNAHPSGATD